MTMTYAETTTALEQTVIFAVPVTPADTVETLCEQVRDLWASEDARELHAGALEAVCRRRLESARHG